MRFWHQDGLAPLSFWGRLLTLPQSLRVSVEALFASGVFVLCCACCAYIYNAHFCGPPIRSDGYGYYAYLPSVFIDHDFSMRTPETFRWTVVGNHPPPYDWDGIAPFPETGKLLDKYTAGTALLQVPFFLAAHIASHYVFAAPANGYSWPYQAANVLAGVFYFSFGTWLLLKQLLSRFSPAVAILTTAAIVFGTGAFHFATYAASFSHAYSFFLVALMLAIQARYKRDFVGTHSLFDSALIGLVLGLITITRVTNLAIALIPLAGATERATRRRNARDLLLEFVLGVAVFTLVCSIQAGYWYSQTGHVLINSYQGEHFNWAAPHIREFLFSVRAGLLFWAPILLVAIPGFPLFIRQEPVLGASICAVVLLEIYICSSWWMWSFGSNFGGARPFVDLMPLIALPLGYGFDFAAKWLGKTPVNAIAAVAIALNLFLMVSKWHNYIPWSRETTLSVLLSVPGKWL